MISGAVDLLPPNLSYREKAKRIVKLASELLGERR